MAKKRPIAKKNKAQMMSQTVMVVAALALVVGLFVLNKQTASAFSSQDAIQSCRLSVGLSSFQVDANNWVKDFTLVDSPFKLNCKTILTEITESSINRADDRIKLSDEPIEKENQIKEAVMRSMKECWYMFGEAKVKIQQAIDTEGTACIVCSEIIPDQELPDKIKDKKKDPIKLENMYTYAFNTQIPITEEKSYWDYFLEGTNPKPSVRPADIDSSKTTLILDKQYSVVFAITAMEKRPDAWFGKGGVIGAGTGIVDCYVGDKGKAKGDDAGAIGCNKANGEPFKGLNEGENPGLIFGNVIDGGTNVELLQWRTFVPVPGFQSSELLRTYPATVRLVPTSQLAAGCNRLY